MIAPIPPIQPLAPSPSVAPSAAPTGAGFSDSIGHALDQVQQAQTTASQSEAMAAAGQGSVSDAMIAASKASLTTQVTVALTNKAVSAFTDVMNLQL